MPTSSTPPVPTRRDFLSAAAALGLAANAGAALSTQLRVYVVPNFHPASCGWLTTFSKERVYCANSYLNHLDRVRDDPNYAFVLSEVNNMIAILNFQPQRFEELKQRVHEGRVELVNSFFLEPTINLSGGEALVKQGIEGLRWQQQMMGVRPRFAWTIDVCGTHDQMGQIAAGLGLEAMVYSRKNPTGSALHWAESPDGSRILAVSSGHYSELPGLFKSKTPLSDAGLAQLRSQFESKTKITPAGAPVLILAGSGDYSLAPAYEKYPAELLEQWKRAYPDIELRFTTAGQYLDAVLPLVRSGAIKIPTMRGGTAYDFNAFWIENPRVKSWYRRCEHSVQAAEMLATIASLDSHFEYPAQKLHGTWILMMLNMDRNTLWGSAGGMVFESETSWDVRDRFTYVEETSGKVAESALESVAAPGEGIALFNPLNWTRNDPLLLALPKDKAPAGAAETVPGGNFVLCRATLPATGHAGLPLSGHPQEPAPRDLPAQIETKFYTARIDPATGAIASLKLKPSGRELLGGPANVIVAEKSEKQKGDPGDFVEDREHRIRLASSNQTKPHIRVLQGPMATTVIVEGEFFGGMPCRRLMRFYSDYPRIDCETDLENIPDRTVVVAEFPLAEDVEEIRRGIPYGFSHGAWSKPNPKLAGWTKGITPAVRWSDYSVAGGGGLALLDRGLSGREITGRVPIVFLYNASAKYYGYPNSWLSGDGPHHLEYAILPRELEWAEARVPHMAWEYNSPPVVLEGRAGSAAQSFVSTSPNVIVEAIRREGPEIELRMAECLGLAGTAHIEIKLPHRGAALTDLVGKRRKPLGRGRAFEFPVRPLQIITLRLRTASPVPEVKVITAWDEFVPKQKLAALHTYSNLKGHPSRGA